MSTGNGNAGTASRHRALSRRRGHRDLDQRRCALVHRRNEHVSPAPPSPGSRASVVSVEVWFRASAYANWSDLASHNWGGTGGSGWGLYLNASRQLTWGLWQSGSTEKNVRSVALTANVIYHAVGTYDGSVIRLYLNGALVASATVGAIALNTTASVFSGRTDTTSPLTVDELAVYAGASRRRRSPRTTTRGGSSSAFDPVEGGGPPSLYSRSVGSAPPVDRSRWVG